MAKQKGDTMENQEKRLTVLDDIIYGYRQKDIKPTNDQLLDDLKKKGFTVSYRTLMRDLTDVSSNNTFVRDLASKSYSKLIEDCFNSMQFVEREAVNILKTKWTRSTVVQKTFPDGNTETTKTVTQELAEPKLKALQIISENAERISKLISGDSLKTSAASWISQRKLDLQTMQEQKMKMKAMEAKIAAKNS